jgi:hypothetical protein
MSARYMCLVWIIFASVILLPLVAFADNATLTDAEVIMHTGQGVCYFFMGMIGIYGFIAGIRFGGVI